MRVLVLGASGGVGRHLTREAAAAGHEVVALVRPSTPFDPPAGVRVVRGELLPSVEAAAEGVEAVLSAVGLKRRTVANPWSALTSAPDLCSTSARQIVAAMRRHGVRRIAAVSAAGVGDSAPRMNPVMRALVFSSSIGVAYRDLQLMEQVFAESDLDWVAPRPTRLTDGPRTGRARVTERFGSFDAISRADVAAWMVAALALPAWPAADWGGRTPQLTG